MTRGAGTCDDGFHIWLEPPRDPQEPFTDSERAQRWRLSLASLLFLTVLLSDRLWFCAEAALARTPEQLGPLPGGSRADAPPRAVFLGNSSAPESCRREEPGGCPTLADADALCRGLSAANMSALRLSFCRAYTLLDLFNGSASPDNLNCSLDALAAEGDASRCSDCVQAYVRYDQHAQEKYEDFELLTEKYEPGAYSVRTCMEQCKTAYKPWLCAQYFPSVGSCSGAAPCPHFCLEVQQSCPFVLPDNDDLIHGGNPSFICTGLLGDHPSDSEADCCDVRWDSDKRTSSSCLPGAPSVTSAAGPRLCSGRLKICLLALVLLQTVIIISASGNSSLLDVAAILSVEESASSEE